MSETLFIKDIVNNLCSKESYENVYYKNRHDIPMPSIKKLNEIMDLLREIIFPGYFGYSEFNKNTMDYFIGFHLEKIYNLLLE
jgi:serine O-acetyltransferase